MKAPVVKIYLIVLSCIFTANLLAQDAPFLSIKKTNEPIKLDGVLSEAVWETADLATNFQMNQPVDDKPATHRTEVRMTYDDRMIYVGAKMWDKGEKVIYSLKRDNPYENDEIIFMLDPLGQRATGYAFSMSAAGVLSEALISPDDFDGGWDNKWFAKVHIEKDFWSVEMAIPFKSIRYDANSKEWAINFARLEPGQNEVDVWSPVARQFIFVDLGYFGKLLWDEAPAKQGGNISLIPYTSSRFTQDQTSGAKENDSKIAVGGDAKIAITPTLNLDLTVNPDFSQVEVDQQVTNLTRFNIFFPERRQFFIDNSDIFNDFGQYANRPFYSRRIGLDAAAQTVPIQYGARLTGNVTERLRVGLLNMHTKSSAASSGQNYTVGTFQQRLWERSSIKGIFSNRQAFDGASKTEGDYGRNLGGEFNYSTADGKWRAKAGYLHAFKEGISNENQHLYGRFDYDGQNFRTFLTVQRVGTNYFSDMGFNNRVLNYNPETDEVVRLGYTQVGNMIDYYHYPEDSERVNVHWSGLENFVFVNLDGSLNEWYTRLRHFIFFKNTSQLRFRLNNNYVDLIYPFALTETPLPAGDYNMTEFNVQFNTDTRKTLSTQMFIVYGQFYGGTKLTYRGSLIYRVQPWGTFTVGLERNDIWLPEPYSNLDLTLASARFDINFSTNLFWTTFLQYNTQADNFNVNSRLQWRFAPMSDIFLVYTDNYAVEGMFGPKDRSVVLKVNYWLNL